MMIGIVAWIKASASRLVVLILMAAVVGLLVHQMIKAERRSAKQEVITENAKETLSKVQIGKAAADAVSGNPERARADCLRDAWNPENC